MHKLTTKAFFYERTDFQCRKALLIKKMDDIKGQDGRQNCWRMTNIFLCISISASISTTWFNISAKIRSIIYYIGKICFKQTNYKKLMYLLANMIFLLKFSYVNLSKRFSCRSNDPPYIYFRLCNFMSVSLSLGTYNIING